MPKRRSASTQEDAIRSVALRFAAEVAELVRGGIADEVSSQVARILEGISRGSRAPLMRGLPRRAAEDRRIGKPPVPVTCPAPGCRSVGIRAKRNFCADHAASLSDAEKNRLREAQRTGEMKKKQAVKTTTTKAAKKRSRKKTAERG